MQDRCGQYLSVGLLALALGCGGETNGETVDGGTADGGTVDDLAGSPDLTPPPPDCTASQCR
jgi:hypothetical protein